MSLLVSSTEAMTALAASFTLGLAGSLHCVGMCGPLACVARGAGPSALWQLGRLGAYALVGVAAGAIGDGFGADRIPGQGAAVSLVLAAGMLLIALGSALGLRLPAHLGPVFARWFRIAARWPAGARARTLGALTPLLPCGLLYGAVAGAVLAGSAAGGAALLAAFALGSMPLLVLAQWPLQALARKLGAARFAWLQRGLLVVAASVLVLRASLDLAGGCCCG